MAMKTKYALFLLTLFLISGCISSNTGKQFSGFWEGPHPANKDKKFYIHLTLHHDTIAAEGFWTDRHFYTEHFRVDSVSVHDDSIRFFIPNWNCFYLGKLSGNQMLKGGFSCKNEAFDSVNLHKNNGAEIYLTEAKPGCQKSNYQYKYRVPTATKDGIPTGRFQSKNNSLFVDSLVPEIIQNKYGRLNSFLVIKDGKLICEEYFYGYTRDDLHPIESSTKSITSLLIGIARDKGMIGNLQEPLYKIFPQFPELKKGQYQKITIENLLTMTSGYEPEYKPYLDNDRLAFSLTRKLIQQPGKGFIYDGGNPEILGAVLKAKTGVYAEEWAQKYLFDPLGITHYDWHLYRNHGYPCMGGSLALLPRDMAKIGMMVLNEGEYNHQQVVSKQWIKESTSMKTTTNSPGDNYAYLWWDIYLHSGKKNYKTIWANGLGSQFIYIIPELKTVIVTTGHNYEFDSWAITKGISKYLYLLDN
ncbi:MAG: serine hydrolase [Bacteroidales bacterium]|nr:serine hydrolase [Bacteroidales bacterium]